MVTMSWDGNFTFKLYIFLVHDGAPNYLWAQKRPGVFTLMALNFFLFGITIMALGVIGEYTGRIYKQIQQRPHYIIRHIYEEKDDE